MYSFITEAERQKETDTLPQMPVTARTGPGQSQEQGIPPSSPTWQGPNNLNVSQMPN